jgi:hypothetical protein
MIVPSQFVADVEFADVVVIPNPAHPAVIVNVCVTGFPLNENVTMYVPGHKFVT